MCNEGFKRCALAGNINKVSSITSDDLHSGKTRCYKEPVSGLSNTSFTKIEKAFTQRIKENLEKRLQSNH